MTKGLLLVFLTVLLSAQNSPQQAKSAGKNTCSRCHQSERRTTIGTPHDDAKACEGCHGEGEKHLKAGGDTATIFDYRRATAEEVRARCGQCHQNPSMQKHAQGDVACTSCHSSHHYIQKKYLLKPQDTELKPA